MHTYGEPGGIYLTYELEFDHQPEEAYVVRNEGGDELDAFDNERDAQHYCEQLTERVSAQLSTYNVEVA